MDAIPPFVFLFLSLALVSIAAGLGIWLFGRLREGLGVSKPPPTTGSPSEGEAVQTGPQELLGVQRMETGELVVFVGGQRYRHLQDIKDRQVGNETVDAVKCVMEFAEGWLPAVRQQPTQPPPAAKPTVDEEDFLEQLRQSDLFPAEKKRSPGLIKGLTKRSTQRSPDPLMTPADAINKIVQQRSGERPDLARHNIRVTTGEDGGLCFHVGLQSFAAVDDIPYPGVREFVQDAVREWMGEG